MNIFKKYCPNVWIAECDDAYEKGEIIELQTKYGKLVPCEVYNLIKQANDRFYYSIVRVEDKTYAERKAEKYLRSADLHNAKSNEYYEKSQEGKEFLSLGEPIKIGHHSENRHRALIDRNNERMGRSIEEQKIAQRAADKAEYWLEQADRITLATPESLEHFSEMLKIAEEYHKGLKDGTYEKEHAYSVTYANNKVKELKKNVEIAKILWG